MTTAALLFDLSTSEGGGLRGPLVADGVTDFEITGLANALRAMSPRSNPTLLGYFVETGHKRTAREYVTRDGSLLTVRVQSVAGGYVTAVEVSTDLHAMPKATRQYLPAGRFGIVPLDLAGRSCALVLCPTADVEKPQALFTEVNARHATIESMIEQFDPKELLGFSVVPPPADPARRSGRLGSLLADRLLLESRIQLNR